MIGHTGGVLLENIRRKKPCVELAFYKKTFRDFLYRIVKHQKEIVLMPVLKNRFGNRDIIRNSIWLRRTPPKR